MEKRPLKLALVLFTDHVAVRTKSVGNCIKTFGKLALVLFKDHVPVGAASQAEYTYAKT